MAYVPVIIRKHNHFRSSDITDHSPGQLLYNHVRMIDFLPSITRFRRDQEILAGWKKHLDDRNIPWAVTMKPGSDTMVLWKEDVT